VISVSVTELALPDVIDWAFVFVSLLLHVLPGVASVSLENAVTT
jgi:hypothetical protein